MTPKEYQSILAAQKLIKPAKKPKERTDAHAHIRQGKVTIGGKTFFARSSWEANIAAYFEWLKQKGQIKDWEHEPETFWFNAIKRGVRSYLPDFRITDKSGKVYFEEVKGYMDAKSKTKLKRMAKYHPQVDIRVLGKDRYAAIERQWRVIPDWGKL